MELIECITCGSHKFNGNKCAYCGNVYETEEQEDDLTYYYNDNEVSQETFDKLVYGDDQELTYPPMDEDFSQTETGEKILKVMIWFLVSIIWFAVCVFIPPLFLITICGLIILVCRKVCKKY